MSLSTSCTVTVTPGMTAPVWSVVVPRKSPEFVFWAIHNPLSRVRKRANIHCILRLIEGLQSCETTTFIPKGTMPECVRSHFTGRRSMHKTIVCLNDKKTAHICATRITPRLCNVCQQSSSLFLSDENMRALQAESFARMPVQW